MKFLSSSCVIFLSFALSIVAQTTSSTPASPAKADRTAAPATDTVENLTVARTKVNKPDSLSLRYVHKNEPVRVCVSTRRPSSTVNSTMSFGRPPPVFGDFLQTQPGDNIAPSNPTETMIGYDAKNLYIAFRPNRTKAKSARQSADATMSSATTILLAFTSTPSTTSGRRITFFLTRSASRATAHTLKATTKIPASIWSSNQRA